MTRRNLITVVLDESQYDRLDDVLARAVMDEVDLDYANDLGKLRDHVVRRTRERRRALGHDMLFEPKLDFCLRCRHKYGSGCGDRCCAGRREIAP